MMMNMSYIGGQTKTMGAASPDVTWLVPVACPARISVQAPLMLNKFKSSTYYHADDVFLRGGLKYFSMTMLNRPKLVVSSVSSWTVVKRSEWYIVGTHGPVAAFLRLVDNVHSLFKGLILIRALKRGRKPGAGPSQGPRFRGST